MKNKKSLILIVLIMLVGLTSGAVASTYAKYTTTIEGTNATATVAKWNFENDNKNQTITVSLDQTVDATTLVANKIAPGTSGSFNIVLKNTSEVGADFEILLKPITDQPTNLKFYKTNTSGTYSNEITPGTTKVTGQLTASDSTGLTVPIYWTWPYETTDGDAADTTDGEAAKTLTIGLDITGTQVQPGTAITSHVN